MRLQISFFGTVADVTTLRADMKKVFQYFSNLVDRTSSRPFARAHDSVHVLHGQPTVILRVKRRATDRDLASVIPDEKRERGQT